MQRRPDSKDGHDEAVMEEGAEAAEMGGEGRGGDNGEKGGRRGLRGLVYRGHWIHMSLRGRRNRK